VREGNRLSGWIRGSSATALFLLAISVWGGAQEPAQPAPAAPPDSLASAVHDLQSQVRELRTMVEEMRAEAAQSRAESAELRRELEMTRGSLSPSGAASPPRAGDSSSTEAVSPEGENPGVKERPRSLAEQVSALEDSSQLLEDKIDQQHQTKVESASKYRVRLSGIVLLNLFSNRGSTDNQDFPSYAEPPSSYSSSGDFGATMRQSELGLEVFGPRLAGARTMGNFQADFAGGFPNQANGVDSGLFRLRVASLRLDWENTSIVAGQDSLFLSPLSPTSFASLALPTFSYAGNLWGWIPQVRLEHRFDLSPGQNLTLQAGILDNLTGEPPYAATGRFPDSGEESGQPGYGARVAWTGTILGQPSTLGTAGYYSRQDWGFGRRTSGWAGMADWEVPFSRWVSFSGEFYRGRALGGLGGGIGRSVLFSGDPLDPTTQIRALNAMGGWSQLKIKPFPKLEFNGAFGVDSPFAADLRAFPAAQSYLDPTLVRNLASLVNFVYRPRSNLLFSTEYRHLQTSHVDNDVYPAGQVNLMMGILF
jgi:outer membrane murein-binding lipoprotein Lpp